MAPSGMTLRGLLLTIIWAAFLIIVSIDQEGAKTLILWWGRVTQGLGISTCHGLRKIMHYPASWPMLPICVFRACALSFLQESWKKSWSFKSSLSLAGSCQFREFISVESALYWAYGVFYGVSTSLRPGAYRRVQLSLRLVFTCYSLIARLPCTSTALSYFSFTMPSLKL